MADPTYDAVGPELVAELTDFTFALRLAGLAVTIESSMNFLRAVAALDSHDHVALFWAGRSALCYQPADFEIYDETFNWFFRRQVPTQVRSPIPRRAHVRLVSDLDSVPRDHLAADGFPTPRGGSPEEPELLQHEDLADLSDDERAELKALLRLLEPAPSERRANRSTPAHRGQLDPVGALRSVLRGGGEVARRRRSLGTRPRTLILLVDTSASMAPHAETLLRFAHAARQKLGAGCEVFTLGDGLVRLSEALADSDSHRALRAVTGLLPAWTGTTRLGPALRAFLDQHGQRGMARGAVVIVVSDGDERGNAELLIEQARRLRRLTRSFIWVNPATAHDGYGTARRGILAVRPFCDHLVAGQSLAVLGELMDISHDA